MAAMQVMLMPINIGYANIF